MSSNEPVSAFAVYSGPGKTSKKRKRKNKKSIAAESNLLSAESSTSLEQVTLNGFAANGSSDSMGKPRKKKKKVKPNVPLEPVKIPEIAKKKKKKSSSDKHVVTSKGPVKNTNKKVKQKQKSAKKPTAKKPATPRPSLQLLNKEVRKIVTQHQNSKEVGLQVFKTLIEPISVDEFMRNNWEKCPLYIANDTNKFSKLFGTQMMDEALRKENVLFGRDIDVTCYVDDVKENHNVDNMRANAHVVWDFYANGCSVRFLHPHSYSEPLLTMNSALQEYFGCLVGANSYLTPPGSQGFAPHYDDIEAFVIQLEGKKRWKLYKPRTKSEELPRYSSCNFVEADLEDSPFLDVTLKAGDVLYFPRGYIHQAHTLSKEHSLHITVSVYQKTAWCDLLGKVVPLALTKAIAHDVDFRKGLPIDFLSHAGLAHMRSTQERKSMINQARNLVARLVNHIDIDSAVDMLGVQYMHDALPPVLSPEEAACTVYENGWRIKKNGKLKNSVVFSDEIKIRLVRGNSVRLVQEDSIDEETGTAETKIRLYFTMDNSKLYHGEDPQFLEVSENLAEAVRSLICSYPRFVTVGSLPCETDEEKFNLVGDLWEHGILMTDKPLESLDDDTEGTDVDMMDDDGADEKEIESQLNEGYSSSGDDFQEEEDELTEEDDDEDSDVIYGNGDISSMDDDSQILSTSV